ncbi:MAG: hypothetical protein H6Q20_2021 [Bacteroidetes bacterium]|nr:hypothetical protein [Bacteroidota bacterium]
MFYCPQHIHVISMYIHYGELIFGDFCFLFPINRFELASTQNLHKKA